ncbi:MAG: metal-dependent hydrolase [Gammaproteobacteria bacterium]
MDTLTHALSGALLAGATLGRAPQTPAGERVRVAFLAAAFPDIDYVVSWIDPLVYLNVHQGPTHSLVLLPAWAAFLTSLAARWYGRRWRDFYGPAFLGVLAHIAGDVITAYGTEVFAPLSFERYAYPIAFVLDPYFTAVAAAGLWLSVHRDSRLAAQIGLGTLLAYLGLLAALRAEALDMARDVARERGLALRDVAALPQPFTPLNWKLLISEGSTVHEAHLRLTRRFPPALGALWFPETAAAFRPRDDVALVAHPRFGTDPHWTPLAREVWRQPDFTGFRRFAGYPVLHRIDTGGAETCLWFTDLRYTLPHLLPAFRFGMCRGSPETAWRLYRLRWFSANERQRLG